MKYGRYEVVKELGKGAMGVVHQAHDPHIDRMVALKVLREDRVTSEAFVKRFLKEAMAIGRLSHPNIVTVFDVGRDHGTIFIAEEFLEGEPLDEILKKRKLKIDEIVRFGVQMAEALDYAHRRGIVHRDIKPSNILVIEEGGLKITDFGIARVEDPNSPKLTQAGEVLGTPYYMSPEQLMGKDIDGRSDIFSMGVMLYEMAAKKRPFTGRNLPSIFHSITETVPEPPAHPEREVPRALAGVIMKALEKKPQDRFANGKELAEALNEVESIEAPTVAVSLPTREPARKSGAPRLIAAAVALLFLGAGGYWMVSRTPPPPVEAPERPSPERPGESPAGSPEAPRAQSPETPEETGSVGTEEPAAETPGASVADAPEEPIAEMSDTPEETPDAETGDKAPDGSADSGKDAPSALEGPSASEEAPAEEEKPREPSAALALLKVESEPQGAQVFIDGELLGATPLDVEIPLGKYEVRLAKKDFYEWEAQINLEEEGRTPLFVRLNPQVF